MTLEKAGNTQYTDFISYKPFVYSGYLEPKIKYQDVVAKSPLVSIRSGKAPDLSF
jgi:hypothetical protein